MPENLKPCPFCGSDKIETAVLCMGNTQIKFKVGCYDCKIWKSIGIMSGEHFEVMEKAIEKLIDDWNRRVDNAKV